MAQISERTIYDNTNSSSIVKHLFLSELKRLDDQLVNINKQNEECHNLYGLAGFQYLGEFYRIKNASSAPTHGERVALHASLYPMMQGYLERSSRLLSECTKVNQMVFRLVVGCINRQDVRDALPECLVAQDKDMGLSSYERTRPAAYTLESDHRAMRQYEKVLPLMEYYAGTQMLY